MKAKHSKASFKGIPKHEHDRIRKILAGGYHYGKTPIAVWRNLTRYWKNLAAEKAAKEQAEAATMAKRLAEQKGWDIATVREGIESIAIVRDKLQGFVNERNADRFIDDIPMLTAYVEKFGAGMEEALFRLGIVEGCCPLKRGNVEGWLKSDLRKREHDLYNKDDKAQAQS